LPSSCYGSCTPDQVLANINDLFAWYNNTLALWGGDLCKFPPCPRRRGQRAR
jgi:hypothetical protein